MNFYLIGVDYKTTPYETREVAYRRDLAITASSCIDKEEKAVLYTCNRIEVYGATADIFSVWRTFDSLCKKYPRLFENAYVMVDSSETIRHALRLACGIESQLHGEEQIIEQLQRWIKRDSFPLALQKMWSKVLAYALDIRQLTALNEVNVDIAGLVLRDLTQRLGAEGKKEIIIIGTGKVAQLFAENKATEITLHFTSRKKHSRARQLAKCSGGSALLLDKISSTLLTADALVSATTSPHYLIKTHHITPVVQRRKKLLYLYDLAVPRDIDPAVMNIDKVVLQNTDDLASFFVQHNNSVKEYIQRARFLIDESVDFVMEDIYDFVRESGNAPKCTCSKAS